MPLNLWHLGKPPKLIKSGRNFQGCLWGSPRACAKNFMMFGPQGLEIWDQKYLYFDELFQRNWKHLSIKLESPTLLQSMFYNIDIYIQLDILTYRAPKKVPKMAIWVSHPNGPVPIHGPCYLPEKSLPAWPGQWDTEIFPGKAVA